MSLTPFYITVQIRDVEKSMIFYGETLELKQGKSGETWVDYNMF